MPSSFQFFQAFIGNLGLKKINLNADTFKAALTNTAPVATTDDELADITEIANGNGYVTGGLDLIVAWSETGADTGIWQWQITDFSWTADGGNIGPFRYIVIYDDTAAGKPLIGYWDCGAALTVADGMTFLADYAAASPIKLRIAA